MAILDLIFSRKAVQSVEDYADIVNRLLSMNITFTVMKFSGTEQGVEMRISIPDEKLKESLEILNKTEGIKIRRSTIEVDEDKCVDCGLCVSLCNTGALHFDKDYRRQYDKSKCVACLLCIDACPRGALTYLYKKPKDEQ